MHAVLGNWRRWDGEWGQTLEPSVAAMELNSRIKPTLSIYNPNMLAYFVTKATIGLQNVNQSKREGFFYQCVLRVDLRWVSTTCVSSASKALR